MIKRTMMLMLLLAEMICHAQVMQTTAAGAYERKQVVTVDSTSAGVLFSRAMEALSDWTGADGRARAGVDYQDRETGTVIYKGTYSLGFRNTFLGNGWERWAEFTLKVKCKDGRAQVTMTVDDMLGIHTTNGMRKRWTVAEIQEAVANSRGNRKERGMQLLTYLKETADWVVDEMTDRLQGVEDDF